MCIRGTCELGECVYIYTHMCVRVFCVCVCISVPLLEMISLFMVSNVATILSMNNIVWFIQCFHLSHVIKAI